ncbi:MAG: M28 family peptidase [Acidobacteriota bacterium]|nr:M28 family peptidase [Acidobacteriota bacterium]
MMNRKAVLFLIALLGSLLFSPAFGTDSSEPVISKKILETIIGTLASDDMEGRRHMTPGGEKARLWLIDWFKSNGFQPAGDDGNFEQSFDKGINILAVYRPEGLDDKAKPAVLISSHYDHHGDLCDQHPKPKSKICNGAADNAGGVAVALAAAKALVGKLKQPLAIGLWDAEEFGLLGSKHFVKNPTFPLDGLRFVVNLDIIGLDLFEGLPDTHIICGAESGGPNLAGHLEASLKGNPLQPVFLSYPFAHNRSDITAFLMNGNPVPFVFLTDGDGSVYHTWADEPGRINYDKVQSISTLVARLIQRVDSGQNPPVFSMTPQSMQLPTYQDAVNISRLLERIASVAEQNKIEGPLAVQLQTMQQGLKQVVSDGKEKFSPQSAMILAQTARGMVDLSKKVEMNR